MKWKLLPIILILVLFGILCGFLDFDQFPLDLVSHFQIPYGISLLAFLILALASRRRFLALVCLVGLCGECYLMAPLLLSTSAKVEGHAGNQIRLYSLNIERTNTDVLVAVNDVLRRNANVVAFYEVTPTIDQNLSVLNVRYPYSFHRPFDHYHGLSIYSQYPIDSIQDYVFGSSKIPAAILQVRAPQKSFALIATHTIAPMGPQGFIDRNIELSELASIAKTLSSTQTVVFAGDLNITPFSRHFRGLQQSLGFQYANYVSWNVWGSWPTWLPFLQIPIDHIFVSNSGTILNCNRGDVVGSDHFPLVMDFIP